MPHTLPPEPQFGDPLPVEGHSPQTLHLLATRRSPSAFTLTAPGPDAEELEQLLRLAARVPDHGKLSPWRFVVLERAPKAAFVAALEAIAAARPDAEKALPALGKLRTPPLSVAVISRVTEGKIPGWEQELSAGAVCMTLLIAARAMGYGANWITDWYAYDARARSLLGLAPEERIAGFIHLGTAPEPPQERVRPDVAALTNVWSGA